MLENFRHEELRFSNSGRCIELDIYIPSLNLALEYQGEYHFKTFYYIGEHKTVSERDSEKKELCKKAGLTIIEIPYWWNGRVESLAAELAKHRPDVIAHMSSPEEHQETVQ